jgi:hypothetical protein
MTCAAYRELGEREPSIPLFSRPWWLDATAGAGSWDAVVVERGGELRASLPFVVERRMGLTLLGQPPLTPSLGPWLRASTAKYANRLGEEKELLEALADGLPPYDRYTQFWHPDRTNWLPFYWRGFTQTTRYTYVLPDLSDPDALWGALRENIRREVQKAGRRFSLRVRDDLGVDAFLALNEATFRRQGRGLPYPRALVERIDAACAARGCRRILVAEDGEGRRHAGAFIVWDENSAYYLMGGADPELRSSGAMSLVLWEAVRHAAGVTRRFDFEGSMVEPIERFFRAFGAVQTPYFEVSRTPSRLLRARRHLAALASGA